jgi:succinoglycan biosynthesis protein ExoA
VSGNTFWQDVIARARATVLGHGRDSTIYAMDREGFVNPTSSGASYRRSVFDRVGMYDEQFDACEDVEFNYRVFKSGFRSYLSPSLAVYYRPRASLLGLFKQMVRYGRGRFQFARKHHDAMSVSQLVPPTFLAGLLLGCVAAYVWPPIRYLYFGVLALYGLTVLLFSARLGLRFGWGHFLAAPFVYATIHLGLGAGFWEEAAVSLLRGAGVGRRALDANAPLSSTKAAHQGAPNDTKPVGDNRVRATRV